MNWRIILVSTFYCWLGQKIILEQFESRAEYFPDSSHPPSGVVVTVLLILSARIWKFPRCKAREECTFVPVHRAAEHIWSYGRSRAIISASRRWCRKRRKWSGWGANKARQGQELWQESSTLKKGLRNDDVTRYLTRSRRKKGARKIRKKRSKCRRELNLSTELQLWADAPLSRLALSELTK